MRFAILDPEKDADQWSRLLSKLDVWRCDVHFTPEYARVQQQTGVLVRLCYMAAGAGFIIQPFAIHLTINSLTASAVCDLASPYGYGGPVAHLLDQNDYGKFRASVDEWARSIGAVTERTVLHPLMIGHQCALISHPVPDAVKPIVFLHLENDFRKGYSHNRIAGLKIAERAGVIIEKVPTTPSNMAAFCDLYRAMMGRKRASARWLFSDEYFHRHVELEGCSLFFAYVGEDIEVATLVIGSPKFGTAHYHFSATAMKHPKAAANDAMIDSIARWARDEKGFARLHLGGGVVASPTDNLLAYKASFSTFRAPVHVIERVIDRERYHDLCAGVPPTDFFPAHRAQP